MENAPRQKTEQTDWQAGKLLAAILLGRHCAFVVAQSLVKDTEDHADVC